MLIALNTMWDNQISAWAVVSKANQLTVKKQV